MEAMAEIPSMLVDRRNGHQFRRGTFLGKGAFARCFVVTDESTRTVLAAKVIAKAELRAKESKAFQMTQEISIHRDLVHSHVVKFEDFFEDDNFAYILLELCPHGSLLDMLKRRGAITEPEVRYFSLQVVSACEYLHGRNIIHRDIKVGNLFLSREMTLKVGDFGLATIIQNVGDRVFEKCGTPSYIAPEILQGKGYSFEVDIWAIGCVIFSMLVGKSPFETSAVKKIYERIRKNDYEMPSSVSVEAAALLKNLLAADPMTRPKAREIPKLDFFISGFTPQSLPLSCLTEAPRFLSTELSVADTLSDRSSALPLRCSTSRGALNRVDGALVENLESDFHLAKLEKMLVSLIERSECGGTSIHQEQARDPTAMPICWISKWADYSQMYGLGYELCDKSVGALFNDCTKISVDAAGRQIHYTDEHSLDSHFAVTECPRNLRKKVKVLGYFRDYMQTNLADGGTDLCSRQAPQLHCVPYVREFFRYRDREMIVFHMSCGTVQINFQNKGKLILCPLTEVAAFVDSSRGFTFYRMPLLARFGCSNEMLWYVKEAKLVVEYLISQLSSSAEARPRWMLVPPSHVI